MSSLCEFASTNNFEVIIGSDIIYYANATKPLVKTIDVLLSHSPNAIFILCNQYFRMAAYEDTFYSLLQEYSLEFSKTWIEKKDFPKSCLFSITRRKNKKKNPRKF